MMSVSEGVKVYLFAEPVDMRKGFDGLRTLVRERGLSLFSGDLFVFISRRGDRVKIPKSLDMSSQQAQFQGYERHPYEHRVR